MVQIDVIMGHYMFVLSSDYYVALVIVRVLLFIVVFLFCENCVV